MPRDVSPAFLLWARAAQSGNWELVLGARLDRYSYVAAWMLAEAETYQSFAMERQAQIIHVAGSRG